MKSMFNSKRGFTLVEIIISLAIILILIGISMATFYSQRSTQQIKTVSDGIVFSLEHARSDALNGKGASSSGVYFASSSITYFNGSSYNSSDSDNTVTTFSSQYSITTTLPANTIVFAHLTGFPDSTGTITITDSQNSSYVKKISIGSDGDISVIQ